MIYIYWAPPRQGKSYCVTAEIVDLIIANKRDVYTNYPVVIKLKDGEFYSSMIWKPELIHEAIYSATIVIDEAYTDFSSRDYKKFQIDTHTFFATNGHNDLDIILIAQNPARIDLIIREMCTEFVYVKKTAFPAPLWALYAGIKNLFGAKLDTTRPRPLFFTLYTYLTEKQMAGMKPDDAWQIRRVWFSERAAAAYDTHYYKNTKKPFEGDSWLTKFEIPEPSAVPQQTSKRDLVLGLLAAGRTRLKAELQDKRSLCRLKFLLFRMNYLDREMKFPDCRRILEESLGSLLSRIIK